MLLSTDPLIAVIPMTVMMKLMLTMTTVLSAIHMLMIMMALILQVSIVSDKFTTDHKCLIHQFSYIKGFLHI